MAYSRVIPRDLFNEAKLLKCLGQLALIIHNGRDKQWGAIPAALQADCDGRPFVIEQRDSDGGLYAIHPWFTLRGQRLVLYTAYNSQEPYPLLCEMPGPTEIEVLDEDGDLTEEFYDYICSQTG